MEQKDTEELYVVYQTKLRSLEQELEQFERKSKTFEQKKERRKSQMRLNQERIEETMVVWGSSSESNATRAILEEYLVEVNIELKKEEEALQEEQKRIRGEQSRCEETYQLEMQKRQEEEE